MNCAYAKAHYSFAGLRLALRSNQAFHQCVPVVGIEPNSEGVYSAASHPVRYWLIYYALGAGIEPAGKVINSHS